MPITQNPSTTFTCSQCHKAFHARCIWGQFFLSDPSLHADKNTRFWLCGRCLVNKNVWLFDSHLRQWTSFFVVSYYPSSRNHGIKRQQEQHVVRLGWFRVRVDRDMNESERWVENTLSQNSIIELRNGIRCYKNSEGCSVERTNWHSFPQIVGVNDRSEA